MKQPLIRATNQLSNICFGFVYFFNDSKVSLRLFPKHFWFRLIRFRCIYLNSSKEYQNFYLIPFLFNVTTRTAHWTDLHSLMAAFESGLVLGSQYFHIAFSISVLKLHFESLKTFWPPIWHHLHFQIYGPIHRIWALHYFLCWQLFHNITDWQLWLYEYWMFLFWAAWCWEEDGSEGWLLDD